MDREEILHYLSDTSDDELFRLADKTRSQSVGDEVHIRAIIEFSNYCKRKCGYCGLNLMNRSLKRYRMTVEQVVETARIAHDEDVFTIVLQSGEDPQIGVDEICRIIEGIKNIDDMAVTVSCGEFTRDEYSLMKYAGADRYLLKIETVNRVIYDRLHPGCDFDNRIRCLHDLRELGFQLGSGSLVGLPNQTLSDIADDLAFCAGLDLDMATFSPFIPHPDTPLGNEKGGTWQLGLRVLAVARLALPLTHIPCSTALASITPDDYISPMRSGANVVMADITPEEFFKYYDLYPGKIPEKRKQGRDNIQRVKKLITSIGRPIASGRGDSLKR